MSAQLGPEPLPATIARAHVGEHRNLFCSNYDACLDRAAHEDWTSWTCSHCARFHAPRSVPRGYAASGLRGAVGRQGDGVSAGRQAEVRARARPRSRSAPTRNAQRDRCVAAHSVEQEENGTLHVRLQAPCMTALFVEAARAVAEVVRGRPVEPAAVCEEELSVTAPDPEHLLMAWIAELMVRSQRSKARFTEVDIVYLSDRQVVTSIRGVRLAHVRSPLKAAAYHDPCLIARRDRVTASPVLDV